MIVRIWSLYSSRKNITSARQQKTYRRLCTTVFSVKFWSWP